MTIPRYMALLEEWQYRPPQSTMVRAIACGFGMTIKQRPGKGAGQSVFWDESYYKDTTKTPHSKDAYTNLARDFAAAGGRVMK